MTNLFSNIFGAGRLPLGERPIFTQTQKKGEKFMILYILNLKQEGGKKLRTGW